MIFFLVSMRSCIEPFCKSRGTVPGIRYFNTQKNEQSKKETGNVLNNGNDRKSIVRITTLGDTSRRKKRKCLSLIDTKKHRVLIRQPYINSRSPRKLDEMVENLKKKNKKLKNDLKREKKCYGRLKETIQHLKQTELKSHIKRCDDSMSPQKLNEMVEKLKKENNKLKLDLQTEKRRCSRLEKKIQDFKETVSELKRLQSLSVAIKK